MRALSNNGGFSGQIISTHTDLVIAHGDKLYQLCRKLTYSKEDAEDLFQETFLKSLEQQPKMNTLENPEQFLFSTAIYLWKSWKRKYARRARLAPTTQLDETIESDIDIEESVLADENARIVNELVASLPEKLKIPIILYYTVGVGVADIAFILKVPSGTIMSRLHRARKILEKGLIDVEYEK